MTFVSAQLKKYRKEGRFSGVRGKELFYEYFQVENSRGAVVVVHGLSEFTEKYYEFAWCLVNQGYDVFLYDQRCHGRSCRLTERMDLIHVDHFSDYCEDLHRFVCQIVRPVTNGPLYLYGHSMGGAVAALYLGKHTDVFQKAVLSAPMILPLTGDTPEMVARWGMTMYLLLGNGKKKCWISNEFDPDYPFERSHDQSYARFQWNMDRRHQNPCYCTTPQSNRWVQQSVSLRPKLTSRRFLEKIKTPILMICPDTDDTVSDVAQQKFSERCPMCQRVVLPDATHGMLCGTKETVTAHVQQVLDHFC